MKKLIRISKGDYLNVWNVNFKIKEISYGFLDKIFINPPLFMNSSRFHINIFDYGLGCLTLKLKAQIKTNKLIFKKILICIELLVFTIETLKKSWKVDQI
jgi:hypothetical protein